MKVQFLGHSSFLMTTSAGTRIVTDPFDPDIYGEEMCYKAFNQPADIVTVSHEHRDHGAVHMVTGSPVIIRGNGKFMAKEVEFLGIGVYHDNEHGEKRGKNTVFIISADGLRIAHMGDLGHILTSDQAAEIGKVDVALVPVGGYYTITAEQAWKVVEQISAKIVVPMHFKNEKCQFPIAGVEDFIGDRANVRREGITTFEVDARNLPAEQTVVVLEPTL